MPSIRAAFSTDTVRQIESPVGSLRAGLRVAFCPLPRSNKTAYPAFIGASCPVGVNSFLTNQVILMNIISENIMFNYVHKRDSRMGRPPLEKKLQQLAVSLPPDVRGRLQVAAEAAGHSLAEEVRRRIDKTIRWEGFDPVTMELLEGLEQITVLLRQDFDVEWYATSRAHEAFVTAVNQRLAGYAPPATVEGSSAVALGMVGPADPSETIGRMRERDDRRITYYEHLMGAQERAAKSKAAGFGKRAKSKKDSDHE
jgi:hypothetical protein